MDDQHKGRAAVNSTAAFSAESSRLTVRFEASPKGLLVKLPVVGGCRESAAFGLARAEGRF
jgi:hypothetical protein